MKAPTVIRLGDAKAEQARAEHHRAITELQAAPLAGAVLVLNVELADGTTTLVPHRLGRRPVFVSPSCPRGAASIGMIEEVASDATDRSKQVALRASGWGAVITVDLVVA